MSLARHRELLILGMVCSHDIHGYALVDALASGLGRAIGLKRPTVYALLGRLEDQGLVVHQTEKDSAYPERRVYRATSQGKQAVADLVRASAKATVGPTVPLSVILAHLGELPIEDSRALLESCWEDLRSSLDDLAAIPAHEGTAGRALGLVRAHYQLDLKAVEQQLANLSEES